MTTLDDYQRSAATLLKQGAPLVAYDKVAEGLRHFPGDTRLRQLLALSLARTGASREANKLLHALVAEGHADEETVGMLARTYKDLWVRALDRNEGRQHLDSAFRWYLEAYRVSGGYWVGINAATLALLLDDMEQSTALARKVLAQCLELRIQQTAPSDAYWVLATLGEAALLVGHMAAAENWYREAVALGTAGVSELVTTRRNARLILRHQQVDATPIEACFRIPCVAVFAGHLIDHPGRSVPRFPPELEDDVRRELHARMRQHDIGFGYSSPGNGGDILFLEGLMELGAELHVVLPYNRAQFVEDSVDFIPGANWAGRFQTALDRAVEVVIASEQRMLSGATSYEYGFLLLDGSAAVRAEELETELRCFAVWDGQEGDGPGGTAAAIQHWRKANRQIDIVDLNVLQQPRLAIVVTPSVVTQDAAAADVRLVPFEAQVVGLLFADVAGFSKLREDEIPRFVEHYLGRVADALASAPEPPLLCNTWGDGIYLVFRGVRETGEFALRLSEALRMTDWSTYGLPSTLSLRMAVHAGPAYACIDPVTKRPNYLGAHVALAARIEPVTPPGEVYGSGAFAALAKANQVREFVCAYVGQTPLAKGFGTFPMYVLRPRA